MDWTLLIVVAVLWLVLPIILLIALIIARRQVRILREQSANRGAVETPPDRSRPAPPVAGIGSGSRRYAPVDLENLLLLRLELQRLADSGVLPAERHGQLTAELDRLWARHLREGGAQPENSVWQHRRALAWGLLAQSANTPPGLPPWAPPVPESAPPAAVATPPALVSKGTPPAIPSASQLPPSPAIPPSLESPPWPLAPLASPPSPPPAPPPLADAGREAGGYPAPLPVTTARAVTSTSRVPEIVAVDVDDWRPAPPTPLERILHVISGWPRLIAPFLAQNIGWFIGGFCFVAGALFLIANTSGFTNALVVFTSLFGASAFLLWAGYQFRRRRPELVVASNMLLTLGMLLAPLVLAVAVRLVAATGHEGLLLAVSLLITAGTLAAFAWAAALTSALMDRGLQGRYAWLLTALATVQLAAPLAGFAPNWQGLAVLHALLVGLLGYGLWTFAGDWLRRLFLDRRLTTYYAAGMLVYTATVSFIHLTWLWPESLPAGYAGPFLMALCGLLFRVDAAFKEWVNQYPFLSRFSFALYALSAVAVAVALQSTPAIVLTLVMGALLYGWMTWRYRSLPPLYLLFGCLAGLYGFGLLHFLPPAWHGLASLPGLLALLGCVRWAGSRSRAIALQCLIVFGGLLVGLTAWSLTWSQPGELGFTTAALAALLGYLGVRLAFRLPEADPRWAHADAGVVALATAAVAYMPSWTALGWGMQTAFGLLALAAIWIALGLHDRRQSPVSRSVFVAGALVSVVLALTVGGMTLWPMLRGHPDLILLLAAASALLLWLSLGLRRRALFYGMLACAAGAGILIKRGYCPGPGSGLNEFVLVLALWWWLWWLERRSRLRHALLADTSPDLQGLPTLESLIRPPLEQAMALLWTVGLAHLTLRLLDGALSAKWPATAALGVLTGLLLMGHFHLFRWVALPFFLGLAGLLVEMDRIGLSLPGLYTATVLYALLVWRWGIDALGRPSTGRLARILGFTVAEGGGGRRQVEESLHVCALLVATAPVAAGLALALLGGRVLGLLPALSLSLLLFVLTGWHYRSAPHAGATLVTLVVGAWLAGVELASPALLALGQPVLNGGLSLLMAMAAIGLDMERAERLAYWRGPLRVVSTLLYGLALAGAVLGFLAGDSRLPGLLALLCAALFPVARPWPTASAWRGLGLPLLLSALVWSLAARFGIATREAGWIAIGWGYALWLIGNLLLPRWNSRQPGWAVAPEFWPLLGLACVLGGGAVGFATGAFPLAAACAGWTPYLFLLLRNTAWPAVAWLAVAALTMSGLLAGGWLEWNEWSADHGRTTLLRPFAIALTWLNLLLLLPPLWRRYDRRVVQALHWRQTELEAPLFWLPFAALVVVLAGFGWFGIGLSWLASPSQPASWGLVGVALLLAVTAGHAFKLRPESPQAHILLLALHAVVGAVLLKLALPTAWLPLAVALWNGALLLAWRHGAHWPMAWREALEPWLILLPATGIGLLFTIPAVAWVNVTVTLLALAAALLAQGWWQGHSSRLRLGLLLALASSYTAWLTGRAIFDFLAPLGLAPWYALQTVLLLLVLLFIQTRLDARLSAVAAEGDEERVSRVYELEQTLRESIPALLILVLLWLGLHAYAVVMHQAGWGSTPWHFGATLDPLAAGAALLLLAGHAGIKAWRRPDEPNWVYVAALWLGLLAAYGRLVMVGLAPFGANDTAAILVAACAAFLLHRFTASRPLYHLALLLPLLALGTVPWQLASPWTGGTLLATAVLYLSLAGTLHNPLPLYLGVLALNGAIYLWAPLWAERYGLWQFYIVPAAVSVLALLHLHRRELRPRVLSGARLAALSALYAGAGLDVFLRPELWVFVLALTLALTGVMLGIALRVRAFLYAGVAFLVLNVAGQLLRFYPEQAMSRALILIGLGTVITVGMVVFNLKREAILQRIRIMRADLAAWE